jgi:aromatic ring hydroxylase
LKQNIIALALALCGFAALAQEVTREAVATAEVTRYVEDWTKDLPAKRRAKIFRYIWQIFFSLFSLGCFIHFANIPYHRMGIRI